MTTAPGDVIFEFIRMGHSVKVTAIHADTMVEAVIICPASLGQNDMKRLALQKLVYVMGKAGR